jgi:hypothetical protein
MSVATALAAVSRSLRTQLLNGMDITPAANVTLLAPDETASNTRRINLFLYQVNEHAHMRNAGPRLRAGSADILEAPPLSLVMSYLMTAYATNDPATGNDEAHAILGEAMRVFHEQPVIPDDALDDDLDDARERLQIFLMPLNPEEISRVWGTFDTPYRLSVGYEVSVVQLDQGPATQRPMAERVRTIGVPAVQAPYVPPRITGFAPPSAPPGATLTVTGENLVGWRATVTISGVEAVAGLPLVADEFTVTVPASLPPGFHQVRADISGLARATTFLEVV